jgi:hypothetical protein
VVELRAIAQRFFAAGIDHHAATMRELQRLAAADQGEPAARLNGRSSSEVARDELLGPKSLAAEFEQIFGPDHRVG